MTRGIIEEIIDKYHVRVRIPEHNGLQGRDRGTPTSELGIATICCPPIYNSYCGSIVYPVVPVSIYSIISESSVLVEISSTTLTTGVASNEVLYIE